MSPGLSCSLSLNKSPVGREGGGGKKGGRRGGGSNLVGVTA